MCRDTSVMLLHVREKALITSVSFRSIELLCATRTIALDKPAASKESSSTSTWQRAGVPTVHAPNSRNDSGCVLLSCVRTMSQKMGSMLIGLANNSSVDLRCAGHTTGRTSTNQPASSRKSHPWDTLQPVALARLRVQQQCSLPISDVTSVKGH